MKTTRKQGFTMIEMLVVIVIIGILAGSLFGPVTNFMLQGNLTGMMGNGRKIVQAIIAADMSGNYESVAWPADENADDDSESDGNFPKMNQSFSTSAQYFNEALFMKETDVTRRNRLKVLKDIEPSTIAGQGIPAATKGTIEDKNCAWSIAKNSANAPAVAPVLVTRNVNVALADMKGNAQGDYTTILNTQKPFQQDGCVIIYKDGSGKKFAADEVTPKNIMGDIGEKSLKEFKQGDASFEFLKCGSN